LIITFLLFLGHNFSTRNTRKSMKGSKYLDYSLVSTKNLESKIPSCAWCPQTGNLSQNGLKPTPLTTSPTKSPNCKLSIFFNAK